jgi:MFS family permease
MFNLGRDGAVEQLLRDPSKATEYASYTSSFLLIGWSIGGLIFGSAGDRFGRARMLAFTLLVYSAGTAASAFAASFAEFCICLLLTGLGVGGVFGLAVALIADSVPSHSRPPALGLLQSFSTVGNIIAAFVGIGIGRLAGSSLLPFGLKPWQTLFLVGAVPAFLCFFFIRRLPEPEEWIRAKEEGSKRGVKFGSYTNLLTDPRWSKHAWLGLIFCCAGIIGLWGLGNFHPKIIRSIVDSHLEGAALSPEALASSKAHWSSIGILMQNIGGFCGMMSMAKLAQTWGRRPAMAVALVLSFLFTVLVFRYLREFSQIFWMLPLMGFGQLGVFSVYAIYLPELFPTSLRSTGTSFCYNFGRLAAATAPFTIGRMTKALGGDVEGFRTAGIWISFVLLTGLITLPFLPETRNQPLPEE